MYHKDPRAKQKEEGGGEGGGGSQYRVTRRPPTTCPIYPIHPQNSSASHTHKGRRERERERDAIKRKEEEVVEEKAPVIWFALSYYCPPPVDRGGWEEEGGEKAKMCTHTHTQKLEAGCLERALPPPPPSPPLTWRYGKRAIAEEIYETFTACLNSELRWRKAKQQSFCFLQLFFCKKNYTFVEVTSRAACLFLLHLKQASLVTARLSRDATPSLKEMKWHWEEKTDTS